MQGYEFMQDFRVHVKLAKDSEDDPLQYKKIPYFCLPGSVAETAIAQSCLACFDYTNSLADLVVGYMASPMNEVMSESMQSISIRNERGNAMLKTALENNRVHLHGTASGTGSHEQITISTLLNDNTFKKMLVEGKVRESGMPKVIGELVAYLITMQGPKGVNFAKYSIDYHVLRNYLHCINVWGKSKTEKMMPEYVKELVEKYEEDSSVSSLINDISGIVV